MSEPTEPGEDLGPTAAIITIGDEIVEGRVLNENATWLSDELMTRGAWPRLVVAVPDVNSMIVSVVRIAAETADLLFVTGGLGWLLVERGWGPNGLAYAAGAGMFACATLQFGRLAWVLRISVRN